MENEDDLVELVIDSELKITDVEWSDNLTNPDSEMFLQMQNDLEEDMTEVFCDDNRQVKLLQGHATPISFYLSIGAAKGFQIDTLSKANNSTEIVV